MIDLVALQIVLELFVTSNRHTASATRCQAFIVDFAKVLTLSNFNKSSLVALLGVELIESPSDVFIVKLVCSIIRHQLS